MASPLIRSLLIEDNPIHAKLVSSLLAKAEAVAFSEGAMEVASYSPEEIGWFVAVEIDANDYVVKPFNPRELLARIEIVLEGGMCWQKRWSASCEVA
ncbi:MAG: hypothetical protein V7731_22045 [Amphritea sp.]